MVSPDPGTLIVLPVGSVGSLDLIIGAGVFVPLFEVVSFWFLTSFFLRMGLAIAADGLGCPVTVIAGCGKVVELATTIFSSLP